MLLQGRYVLRLAIGQRTTQERHVRATRELIKTEAEELLRS
jgi:hypothetical protein